MACCFADCIRILVNKLKGSAVRSLQPVEKARLFVGLFQQADFIFNVTLLPFLNIL